METIGCSGMTHSAAMAAEILPGRTLLESVKHRPCVRCHQHSHERTVPADRLRQNTERVLRGRPSYRSWS